MYLTASAIRVRGSHCSPRHIISLATAPHSTLTANIRRRRGEKVSIYVPLFMDKHTDPEVDVKDGERALDRAQEALHTPSTHTLLPLVELDVLI